jgi:predicted Zn-dependent peptidase
MEITQAKLCLGFTTPITNQTPEFAAMQVFNVLYGAGMTSKLFMNVREKLSLCYAIGSGYYGSKGIMTVSAGIDTDKEALTRKEIFAQLEACRTGDFTVQELDAAKEAILSSIRSVHDSPGAIESYYSTSTLSGNRFSLQDYRAAVEQTTALQVAEAARSLQLHSSFILKGVTA